MEKCVNYQPKRFSVPERLVNVPTAWRPNETILQDIIDRFHLSTYVALEFGVDYGFSTSALANYFGNVIGVDHFQGDMHAGKRENLYEQTRTTLADFPNIELVQMDFREFIQTNNGWHDLIHVDIQHDYESTYECGIWSARHADVVLFHDTESFPEVKRAVEDISKVTRGTFYNFPVSSGLGILVM